MLDFSILIGFWRRSDMPRRIQRKRTRDWVKPEGVRVVDRTTIFGNAYKVGEPGVPDRTTATRLYERDLLAGNLRGYRRPNVVITVEMVRDELRGFDLACFCELDGEPCHADVLLAIANQ
jgi:hypothetical protein